MAWHINGTCLPVTGNVKFTLKSPHVKCFQSTEDCHQCLSAPCCSLPTPLHTLPASPMKRHHKNYGFPRYFPLHCLTKVTARTTDCSKKGWLKSIKKEWLLWVTHYSQFHVLATYKSKASETHISIKGIRLMPALHRQGARWQAPSQGFLTVLIAEMCPTTHSGHWEPTHLPGSNGILPGLYFNVEYPNRSKTVPSSPIFLKFNLS